MPVDRLAELVPSRVRTRCPRGSVGGTLIAVGGGAFLVPDRLAGISEVVRVPHGDCANAVGAATAQISGETDQVYRDLSRADAIAAAEAQAIVRATEAGADPATITVVEVEDMPLAYLPGMR